MRRVRLSTIFVFACLVSTSSLARPQGRQLAPLPINDVLEGLRFSSWVPINLSPDGRSVGFTLQSARSLRPSEELRYSRLTRTGVPSELVGSDIWIADTS